MDPPGATTLRAGLDLDSFVSVRGLLRQAPSVPIPKFANTGGALSCELRNQRDTSNLMIPVPLLNPKFAIGLPARLCELRVRGTGASARCGRGEHFSGR